MAYKSLMDEFDLSQQEVAKMTGKHRSSVANTMRLLGLPEEVRKMVSDGRLGEGHARALLSLTTGAEQVAMAERIARDNLNVRQVEGDVGVERARHKSTRMPSEKREKAAHIKYLEDAISQHLGTRVKVEEKRSGKGRMIIEFYSHDEFERLAQQLGIPLPR